MEKSNPLVPKVLCIIFLLYQHRRKLYQTNRVKGNFKENYIYFDKLPAKKFAVIHESKALHSLLYVLSKLLKTFRWGTGRSELSRDFIYRDHADHEGSCWST
jgi:hypothetical protein